MNGSLKEKILPVLASLPVLPEKSDMLETEALNLAITFGLARTQDGPGNRQAGTAKASREMVALANELIAVNNRLHELPGEARDALERQVRLARDRRASNEQAGIFQRSDRVPPADIFALSSLAFANAVMAAEQDLANQPKTLGQKPRKRAASQVTLYAFRVFERLTGRRPTISTRDDHSAGGELLRFVTELFDALGIEASAEAQIRAALAKNKEKRAATKPS